jgi:hypothetical protein
MIKRIIKVRDLCIVLTHKNITGSEKVQEFYKVFELKKKQTELFDKVRNFQV